MTLITAKELLFYYTSGDMHNEFGTITWTQIDKDGEVTSHRLEDGKVQVRTIGRRYTPGLNSDVPIQEAYQRLLEALHLRR